MSDISVLTESQATPAALRLAANRLVAALAAHADPEYRLAVLKRVVRRLGDERYPVFLGVLGTVAESDDADARHLVADTFATALRRIDLPGGPLSSWGAARLPESSVAVPVREWSGAFFGAVPRRLLGPIEYLTVWHLQRTQRTTLGPEVFVRALSLLVDLFNCSDDARLLYPAKLAADAQNELEGAYARTTRECLAAMAARWMEGASPLDVAHAALVEAPEVSGEWVLRTV